MSLMQPGETPAVPGPQPLDEQTLHAFQHANPHFFYVYELLGDYYHATGQQDKALRNWKKALLLPIPKRSESERIEHKINN